MNVIEAVLIVSGFFVLRFVVPLAVAVAVCRVMNQYQNRRGVAAQM